MTTFQDPQPQSRRAARQSERSGTAEAEVGVFPAAAAADDMWDTTSRRAAQLPPATPATPVELPAATSGRRSAATDAPAPQAVPEAQPQAPQAIGEPLDYVTQQRPVASVPAQAPEPMRRPRGAAPDAGADLPPTEALQKIDQPRYRVRDYSPPPATSEAAPVAQPSPEWTEPYTPDRAVELDYQTQSRVAPTPVAEVPPTLVQPVIPAAQAPMAQPVQEPVAEVPVVQVPETQVPETQVPETQAPEIPAAEAAAPEAPAAEAPAPVGSEHTLTRRELRALQGQAPDAAAAPQTAQEPVALQEPAAPETVSPGTPTGILSSLGFLDETAGIPVVAEADVVAEPAAPTREPESSFAQAPEVPVLQEPVAAPAETPDASVESAWPFALVEPTAQQDAPAAAAPAAVEPTIAQEPTFESPLPPVAPEPIANTGLTAAFAEFDQLTAEPADAPAEPVAFAEPTAAPAEPAQLAQFTDNPADAPWTPPRGHWSAQLDQEDEFVETTVNRTVGSGATATSSLLLPSIPEANISGPLNGSGEILLTGSIDLPQTFSATGASARLEHVGIDKLFESHDAEIVSTESAPVSAVNAISTKSGSGLGAAPKQQGTKALTALVIAAASMGVVVIGLLITALALNVF